MKTEFLGTFGLNIGPVELFDLSMSDKAER